MDGGPPSDVKNEKESTMSKATLEEENVDLKRQLDQMRREIAELKESKAGAIKERIDKGVQTIESTSTKVEQQEIDHAGINAPADRKSPVRKVKKRSPSPLGSYIGPEFLGRPPAKVEVKDEDEKPRPAKRHKSLKFQPVVPFLPVSFPPDDDGMVVDDFDAGQMPNRGSSRLSTPPPSRAGTTPLQRAISTNPSPVKREPVDDNPTILRQPSKARPNVVIKTKDFEFDAVTIQSRIDAVGVKPFVVDIDPEIKEAVVSRRFLSHVYGGSSQGTFPDIAEKRVKQHGIKDFMFASLHHHPNAPREAGLPGVWFLQEPDKKLNVKDEPPKDDDDDGVEFEAEDDGENGQSDKAAAKEPAEGKSWLSSFVFHTFVGLSPGQWRYLGQYEIIEGLPLTQQEWILQSTRVRNAWAHALLRYDWGKRIRFSVIYRREHGIDPTDAEIRAGDAEDNNYDNVTADEIRHDFDIGKQQLGLFVMRCVGYDKAFARSIAEAFPNWVPPPTKKSKKADGKKKTSASKGKEVTKANKRGKPSSVAQDDVREDESDDEPVYIPRPTKSRSGAART